MQNIILDFTGCKYLGELHRVLKDGFEFPAYYGENLDALWDCLDNYCDYELRIYIKGLHKISKELEEYVQKMLDVFSRVNQTTPNMIFEIIS